MTDIVIIGAGASGLTAACAVSAALFDAYGEGTAERARITLLEATDKVGRPILRSGNGRCNLSNLAVDPELYHGGAFAGKVLAAFESVVSERLPEPYLPCPNGVIRYFTDLGLLWEEVAEGRVYPMTQKASTVLNTLMGQLRSADVGIRLGAKVTQVMPPEHGGDRFFLRLADGEVLHAHQVICAVGGRGLEGLELPLPMAALRPVLGPVAVAEQDMKGLDGIRLHGVLSVRRRGEAIFSEGGEVLLRKYGLSGIVTFNASRFVEPGDILGLDLFPDLALEELAWLLHERHRTTASVSSGDITCMQCLSGIVLPAVASAMLTRAGFDADAPVTDEAMRSIAAILKSFSFTASGIADADTAQAMRGGVRTDAVDANSLECHGLPGLFITGESLDVDGPCGGYNLHWAFATGLLSGWSAASRIIAEDRRA